MMRERNGIAACRFSCEVQSVHQDSARVPQAAFAEHCDSTVLMICASAGRARDSLGNCSPDSAARVRAGSMGMEPRYGTCHAAAISFAPEEFEQKTCNGRINMARRPNTVCAAHLRMRKKGIQVRHLRAA